MRRVLRALGPGLLLGLTVVEAGCHSDFRPWVEPEEHQIKIISDAAFLRTRQGDYVDGYLAEYAAEFETKRLFIVLEVPRYVKGERLTVTGRFLEDSVRMPGPKPDQVPVFEVERAQPTVPKAPDIPPLK